MPSGREFVDANVLVYAEDASAGRKQEAAAALMRRLWTERTGCLSVQVLQEFFVTVTSKVRKPMSAEGAEERVRDLSHWIVFAPTASDVLGAISLARQHRLSFWDAMVVEAAAQLGCPTLWTEDLQDGLRLRGVTIRNPFRPASM
jgi:predicted nucleic acid-binding protein